MTMDLVMQLVFYKLGQVVAVAVAAAAEGHVEVAATYKDYLAHAHVVRVPALSVVAQAVVVVMDHVTNVVIPITVRLTVFLLLRYKELC
jgi:hypothetical protein